MQRVVRHVKLCNIAFDIGERPIAQWVEFPQTIDCVKFAQRQGCSRDGLLGALPCQPCCLPRQCALQGFDLAHVAAGFAQFNRFVECVFAVLSDVLRRIGLIGGVFEHSQTVVVFDDLDHV